jgi:micrococcal nuclease
MSPALLRLAAPVVLLGIVAVGGTPADRLPGPIAATVIGVVDGDTLVVRAHIWLHQSVETHVRLRGIDTPEKRGRCPEERAGAARAEAFVRDLALGRDVRLRDIQPDKYGGRVVARVETAEGVDLAETLVRHRLARTYDGAGRASWCS